MSYISLSNVVSSALKVIILRNLDLLIKSCLIKGNYGYLRANQFRFRPVGHESMGA